MEFIDLAAQQVRVRKLIEKNIQVVLDHGQYIMGPEILELEKQLAKFIGAESAISCASGTDALLLALLAEGVGPGDAVFTSPFTFIATAEVISLLGATPVFVDIDPKTFNIDASALELTVRAISSNDQSDFPTPYSETSLKPRGIIAVDIFGLPSDYEAINSIARRYNLFVIEDAAQSFGADVNGVKAGNLADIGCTSFFPAKPLGGYGDGGMCFTGNKKLADTIRSLRVHGKGNHKYDNVRVGINGRLDTLQAAILLAKFTIFPKEIELRQMVAERYKTLLEPFSHIKVPFSPPDQNSAWAQYSILAKDGDHRRTLQKELQEAGIPTAIYYPKPLHLQSAFSYLRYKEGDFKVTEDCSWRIFSLPMHPYLKGEDQEKIAKVIGKIQ